MISNRAIDLDIVFDANINLFRATFRFCYVYDAMCLLNKMTFVLATVSLPTLAC